MLYSDIFFWPSSIYFKSKIGWDWFDVEIIQLKALSWRNVQCKKYLPEKKNKKTKQ